VASYGSPADLPEIEIYFDEIESRTVFAEVRDLLAEWRFFARDTGGVPREESFERSLSGPGSINMMVLRAEDGDFRYEYVGNHISALFGHDPTGKRLSELRYRGAQAYEPRYKYCIETGAPLFAVQRKVSFGVPGASERLLLPIRHSQSGSGMLVYVRSRADNYDLIRAVFNASQDGVLVVSALRNHTGEAVDFEITAINSAAAALIGEEPVDLVGTHLKSLVPHIDLGPVWPDLMTSLEQGVTRVFESLETPGPNGGFYRISSAKVGDGLAITISDLSQLQKALQTLETQHASLVKVNAELRSEVVRRRRLEAELKQLAETDPLTGIANRRSFTENMTRIVEARDENSPPTAVILFDIDDFKAVNDRFGHPVGDAVLQGVARTVSEHFGDGALFGRFGGEEFAVFLPNAPEDVACGIAERLRAMIAEHAFGTPEARVKVTASFGVKTVEGPCKVDDLVALADEALYLAKREGRNRVECHCGVDHSRPAQTG
jgi:diguanylate cyclase (GGDEF)-like protein